MASVFLLQSNYSLYCFRKRRGHVELIASIDNRHVQKRLHSVLAEHNVYAVHLVTDLAEEEYLIETDKDSGFFQRKDNRKLLLYRTFPQTRYRLLGEIPPSVLNARGGESKILCAGIRNSVALDQSLKILEECGVPVSGVYSLAMLLQGLIVFEIDDTNGYSFLVSGESGRQWRYSLFKGRSLLISRCIASQSGDAWVDIYNEIRGTLKYAKTHNYLPDKVKPKFLFAGPVLPLSVMGMHVHKKLSLSYTLEKSPDVSLYTHCIKQFSPIKSGRFQFYKPESGSAYHKLRTTHVLLFLVIVGFLGSMAATVEYLNDSASTAGFSKSLQRENNRVQQLTDNLQLSISKYPHQADEVVAMVTAFRRLDAETNLRELISALADALTAQPRIRLEELRWIRFGGEKTNPDITRYSRRQIVEARESTQLIAELSIRAGLGTVVQQKEKADFLTQFIKSGVHVSHADVQRATDQYRVGKLGESIDSAIAYRFEIILQAVDSESS